MHNPTLIPVLLKDTSINKGLIYRELRKALPCRIGIEFEMGKLFLEGFKKKYDEKATDKSMTEYYGVYEILSDTVVGDGRIRHSNDPDMDDLVESGEPIINDRIIETRVSIKDFHQLSGLYRFMQDLPEFCLLHEGGGIHIHIDMSMFNMSEKKVKEIQGYITNRLNIVSKLFPPYKGKYNKREVGIRRKATWVNISGKHTLEFRILPLTFDYYTLMTWITGVVKFRNILIHECKLVPSKEGIKNLNEEPQIVINEIVDYPTPTNTEHLISNMFIDSTNDDTGYTTISNNGSTWQIRETVASNSRIRRVE